MLRSRLRRIKGGGWGFEFSFDFTLGLGRFEVGLARGFPLLLHFPPPHMCRIEAPELEFSILPDVER